MRGGGISRMFFCLYTIVLLKSLSLFNRFIMCVPRMFLVRVLYVCVSVCVFFTTLLKACFVCIWDSIQEKSKERIKCENMRRFAISNPVVSIGKLWTWTNHSVGYSTGIIVSLSLFISSCRRKMPTYVCCWFFFYLFFSFFYLFAISLWAFFFICFYVFYLDQRDNNMCEFIGSRNEQKKFNHLQ